MNGAKNDILTRIRAAYGSTPFRETEYEAIARNYQRVSNLNAKQNLELFVDRLHDYGAAVYRCVEDEIPFTIAQALFSRGKTSVLIPRDLPRNWLPDGFQFYRDTLTYIEIDVSQGVLTDCALAIAPTGTIVLRHGPREARRALSLIPDYHLCVVFAGQIAGTVPEAVSQIRTFGNVPVTTISGPSATSDIEMTRVKGVHGPRTLDIILVGEKELASIAMSANVIEKVFDALEEFQIEIPSWGFANTGTRFGKFTQAAAAATIDEKFSDAGQVHALTGVCPTMALHVLWDFPDGLGSVAHVGELADRYGVRPGCINPNLFQDQIYKYGSFANPDPVIRAQALRHSDDSIAIARELRSRDISYWFTDGSNYPGTANIRQRKTLFADSLKAAHAALAPDQRMLVEYKPFEPAFYHTDIADWGMALLLARAAGPQAKVLVDTGHHYLAQNIEQIVAWLLSEDMLGGFHFNDRRYADDDLTMGSIDPYQVFRIFHEILFFEWEEGRHADIAYMIDQSHNLKGKIEATIQTVGMAQELFAKAALVNYGKLEIAQKACDLIAAEACLQDAFATDVRPVMREWRATKGLPQDPLLTFRQSGYLERISLERAARNTASAGSYA